MKLSPRIFIISFTLAIAFSFSNLINADTIIEFEELQFHSTIIEFEELQFHSKFEESVFNEFKKTDRFDYFKLFLAVDKKITNKDYNIFIQLFNYQLNFFQKNELKKYRPKKKIKKIYSSIHKTMLDKYVEKALFSSIFTDKEYQCVTASMLYSLFFEELEIPYNIEYIPRHIYLTAFPKSDKIHVETTNPNKGVFIYNSQYKSSFIEHLRNNKLISKNEYETKSTDELFQEYYLQTKHINKKELAGTLYYNLGIKYLEKTDIENSYISFLKSYYLFPSEQNKYFLSLSLSLLIDKTRAADVNYAKYLNQLSKLTAAYINIDMITGLFNNVTYQQLIVNGNLTMYKTSYKTIIKNISDTSLLLELEFVYSSAMGNQMVKRNKYKQAQNYYKKALQIKVNNSSVQEALISVITSEMLTYYGRASELRQYQDTINSIVNKYPSLQNNVRISNLKLNISLNLMSSYYQEKNIPEAKKQQQIFESIADQANEIFSYAVEENIETAYSAAAVYYYKRGHNKTAKSVINKGLHYCPNNYRLKMRLDALK